MSKDFKEVGWTVYNYAISQYRLNEMNKKEGIDSMAYSFLLACVHQELTPETFDEYVDELKGNYLNLFEIVQDLDEK